MKKLLALTLLLLMGCEEAEKFTQEQKAAENERTNKIAQSYIGLCYTDWDGSRILIEPSEKMSNTPGTGLSLCHLVHTCDFKDESKCVTAKICSHWVRNDYFLDTVLKRVKPPTKCE